MVKKIRIMLDYKCYPVWLYDENGDIIDTLLPEELRDDADLDSKFDELQDRYEALFIDDGKRFEYIGFGSEAEKASFLHDWGIAVSELTQKAGDKYIIIDEIEQCI